MIFLVCDVVAQQQHISIRPVANNDLVDFESRACFLFHRALQSVSPRRTQWRGGKSFRAAARGVVAFSVLDCLSTEGERREMMHHVVWWLCVCACGAQRDNISVRRPSSHRSIMASLAAIQKTTNALFLRWAHHWPSQPSMFFIRLFFSITHTNTLYSFHDLTCINCTCFNFSAKGDNIPRHQKTLRIVNCGKIRFEGQNDKKKNRSICCFLRRWLR